jgi:hypothetical protein
VETDQTVNIDWDLDGDWAVKTVAHPDTEVSTSPGSRRQPAAKAGTETNGQPEATVNSKTEMNCGAKVNNEKKGLDLSLLAHRCDFTGDNIRNALLEATYLAEREHHPLAQRHLMEATITESSELGRLADWNY